MSSRVQVRKCLVYDCVRAIPKDDIALVLADGNRLQGTLKNITENNAITVDTVMCTDTSSMCLKRVVGNVFSIRIADIIDMISVSIK